MKGLRHGHQGGEVAMRTVSIWILAAGMTAFLLGSTGPSFGQQTIRVGWTIPAEETKYWMMKRPAEFPDLGKTYNIEWTQFQGTSPMTQALAAGAPGCAAPAPPSRAHGRGGRAPQTPHPAPPGFAKTRRAVVGPAGGG